MQVCILLLMWFIVCLLIERSQTLNLELIVVISSINCIWISRCLCIKNFACCKIFTEI